MRRGEGLKTTLIGTEDLGWSNNTKQEPGREDQNQRKRKRNENIDQKYKNVIISKKLAFKAKER